MSKATITPEFGGDGFDRSEVLLDAYLHGELTGAELVEFERAMESDPGFKSRVELQRRIDASLKATFAPPTMKAPTLGLVHAEVDASRATRRLFGRRLTWFAAAAAVLLVAFVGVRLYVGNPELKIVTPDFAYRELDRRGWKPAFVCKTREEFASLVRKKLGQALIPAADSTAVLLGWGYASNYEGTPISEETLLLLTTVESDRVLVLMDKKRNDRRISLPADGTLRLFKRKVGGLVLYEITPRQAPAVIDKLVLDE